VGQIYDRYYGDTVKRRRPVFMNKPAKKSTPLPWRATHGATHGPLPPLVAARILCPHGVEVAWAAQMIWPVELTAEGGSRHQDVPTGPRCLPPGTPIVTIWTAIDAATAATGCMQMVRTHRRARPTIRVCRRGSP
jgi:hypothetical protein